MGTNVSRATGDDDNAVKPIRKQIGKRSSVTLLGRFDSRSTSAKTQNEVPDKSTVDTTKDESAPTGEPPKTQHEVPDKPIVDTTKDSCAPTGDPRHYSRQISSQSATTIASKPATVVHHKSTISAESTITTIGPSNKDGIDEVENTSEPDSEQEPSLPPSLPAPSVLDRESPSKYGFDDVMKSADSMLLSKRRTLSGPELFEVSRPCNVSNNTDSDLSRPLERCRNHQTSPTQPKPRLCPPRCPPIHFRQAPQRGLEYMCRLIPSIVLPSCSASHCTAVTPTHLLPQRWDMTHELLASCAGLTLPTSSVTRVVSQKTTQPPWQALCRHPRRIVSTQQNGTTATTTIRPWSAPSAYLTPRPMARSVYLTTSRSSGCARHVPCGSVPIVEWRMMLVVFPP